MTSFNPKTPSARADFIGLTGSEEAITGLARAYRAPYQAHYSVHDDSGYSYDHDGGVFLLNPEGDVMTYYAQGIQADEMAGDLMLKL